VEERHVHSFSDIDCCGCGGWFVGFYFLEASGRQAGFPSLRVCALKGLPVCMYVCVNKDDLDVRAEEALL